MKIKEGYVLREVARNNIVVPLGDAEVSFKGIMTLNDVGTFIWKMLENGATKEELLNAVLNEYDVDEETASKDIDRYIVKLRAEKIIED